MAKVVAESVVLDPSQACRGRGGELGGRDRSGRRAGAQWRRVPSGAPDCWPVGAREREERQKAHPIGLPQALAAFAPEFTPEMARLLEPAEGMKTRSLPGGTAPAAVSAALEEARQRIATAKMRETHLISTMPETRHVATV